MLRSLHFLGLIGAAWLKMLPPANALQGDGKCGLYICVNATVHHDIVTYEMTALEEPLGWLALGFGTRMKDTHMVVMWPNEDGTTTLSQRKAFGHYEPLPVEYPPRRASVVEPRISTLWHPNAVKTLSFSVPINKTVMSWSNPTEHLIWAYSKARPEKPSYSELTQHYTAGFLRLNLGGTVPEFVPMVEPAPHVHKKVSEVPASEAAPVLVGTWKPPVSSHDSHESIIVAHALLGSLGFLVLLPAGALFARWGRTLTSKWFSVHRGINLSLAFPIITLGWVLGPIAVFEHRAPHFSDTHQITGILLVFLYYLQVTLGKYIHQQKEKALHKQHSLHPPSNILHIILGLSVILLAFVQVQSGMDEWEMTNGDTHLGHWCHVLWNAWAMTVAVAYLAGTLMLRRQFFQERHGMSPNRGAYLSLSLGASDVRPLFQLSNDSDEAIDQSLSRHLDMEISKAELELPRNVQRVLA